MRARKINLDGSTEPLELPDGSEAGQLRYLYDAIGCTTVEVVQLVLPGPGRPGLDMWIDEEGLCKESPLNVAASLFAADLTGYAYRIHGVVVLGSSDDMGAWLPLSETLDAVIEGIIRFEADLVL